MRRGLPGDRARRRHRKGVVSGTRSGPGRFYSIRACDACRMGSQAERDARVAEAAEAWLADPMRKSLYGELLSAVRSRRAAGTAAAPVPSTAPRKAPVSRSGSVSLASLPKQHRNPEFLAAKQSRLREEHVAPVQAFVDEIRQERGTESVPYVDPESGGVSARVLFILESPAGPAALGSGMLSPDNDDETAANMWRLYEQSGLPRSTALHWNAVPWYVGDDGREKSVKAREVLAGALWLDRLLDLLPELRLVVTMGKPAEQAFKAYVDVHGGDRVEWLAAPHPSPKVKHGHAHLWPQVEAAFERAAEVSRRAGEAPAPVRDLTQP